MAKGQTPWGRMGLRRWKFFQLRRKEREEQGLAPRPPHREASFEPAVAKRRKKQWQNIKRRGFTDPAPLPAGTRLRTREDAQRAAAAHAEFLGLWPKSACSTELGPDGAGEILDGSAEDSGGTHRWHRDSPCCAGRTTQLSLGPFPAGGSRYPFVVLPERHICGLLIRDKSCTLRILSCIRESKASVDQACQTETDDHKL